MCNYPSLFYFIGSAWLVWRMSVMHILKWIFAIVSIRRGDDEDGELWKGAIRNVIIGVCAADFVPSAGVRH